MIISAISLRYTVKSFKKQLQLNFFADYTKRYQGIILHFPENINENNFDIEKLPYEQKNKTLRYMRAYFDLCSEEYYLYKKNDIDKNTWKEWESGIKFALSKPAFQQAWKKISNDTKFYSEFNKFVVNALSENGVTIGSS